MAVIPKSVLLENFEHPSTSVCTLDTVYGVHRINEVVESIISRPPFLVKSVLYPN